MKTAQTATQIKAELTAKIQADMARETAGIELAALISDLIREKWTGKKITKVFCTQLATKLAPGATVYLDFIAGMCNLKVYGVPTAESYDNPLMFFMGYDKATGAGKLRSYVMLNADGFMENNGWVGEAAIKRNENRAKLLAGEDLEKITAAIAAVNEARKELKHLTRFEAPGREVRYFAEKLAGLDKN